MKTAHKLGIAALALAMGASLLAMHPRVREPGASLFARQKIHLAAASAAPRSAVNYQLLDARLRDLMTKPSMVGLAVGVVENGHITFLQGYGETHEGSGDPVTPQTVFRWASVSKGVAATAMAKLAEEGKIDLNAPIAKYSADLKLPAGNETRATLTDLLSHRVGLYRNAFDNKLEEGVDPAVLRQSLVQLNPTCPPGTCWSYQNIAYDTSSTIVSRETGLPYPQAVKQLLFNPIGMASGSATMPDLESNASWARPHSAGKRELPMVDTYYKIPGAGGINSNIKDMTLWMMAQMGERPDVLDAKLLATIHARLVKTPTERGRLRLVLERLGDAWYGLGWRSYDYAGHVIVGHRGGINGYRSLILFDPQLKSGVVALWNSNTSQPGGLEFEVMDSIYHLPFRDWLKLGAHESAPPADSDDTDIASGEPAAPPAKHHA